MFVIVMTRKVKHSSGNHAFIIAVSSPPTKKADVTGTPEEFHYVGLLINSPPGMDLNKTSQNAFYLVIRFIE